jgi:hypothetical protein
MAHPDFWAPYSKYPQFLHKYGAIEIGYRFEAQVGPVADGRIRVFEHSLRLPVTILVKSARPKEQHFC